MSSHKVWEREPFTSQSSTVQLNPSVLSSDSLLFPQAGHLLTLSASSDQSLLRKRLALARHLKLHKGFSLAELAYTLQLNGDHKSHRWMGICANEDEVVSALEGKNPEKIRQGVASPEKLPVFFMFPGQGSEFVRMGLEFYRTQSTFRQAVDQCCEWAQPILKADLRTILYPAPERSHWAAEQLQRLSVMQPALFVLEYGLARLFLEWGVHPDVLIGHSAGEYVVAALSGVMSVQDALFLVSIRGQLLEEVVLPGGMLAVSLSEVEIQKWLVPGISLAAINAPDQCVLSGAVEPLTELANNLTEEKIYFRPLAVTRAGHSPMLESILPDFIREAAKVQFHQIDRPYLSSVAGGWISGKEVGTAEYWVRQLRTPVRFASALESLLKKSGPAVLLELGPGQALSSVARLVRRNLGMRGTVTVVSSMLPMNEDKGNHDFLLQGVGKLWLAGTSFDWQRFYSSKMHQLSPLPALEGEYPEEENGAQTPTHATDSGEAGYRPPRNATEELLCNEWRELFGVEEIGIHDDFFELGGNSLTAMRLFARVHESIGSRISPRTIFEHPTIAQLAEFLHVEALIGLHGSSVPAKSPRLVLLEARPEFPPLSYGQQRLWFIDQLEGPSSEYNFPEVLLLRGELDLAALQGAVSAIVVRHEVLRTHFAQIDGEPVQVIESPPPVCVALEDFSEMDALSQQAKLASVLDAEWNVPFDLSRGPVWRVRVLKLNEQAYVLVRTFHHIAFDGWSLGLFNRELAAFYNAFSEGQPGELPPLPVQYSDFAIWQRASMDAESLVRYLRYWKRQLAGIPEQLDLPRDRERTVHRAVAARMHRVRLDEAESAKLQQMARDTNSTLYMVLLATFATLLARYSGQDDIVVGSPVSNRCEPQLEQLIGFFINSLPIRVSMDLRMSFSNLLSKIRTVCLDAYQYKDLPFERIVEELLPHRSLNSSAIFQVLFAFQNTPRETLQLHRLTVEPIKSGRRTVSADIELHAVVQGHSIELQWAYSVALFDQWRIEQMARNYLALLTAAIREPETPLYWLSLLGKEEPRFLQQCSGGMDNHVFGTTLCTAFEMQARRTPENEAVVAHESILTYRELNEEANRLAHYLIDLGISPEMMVGVCLERSAALAIVLLAILKSGGAYLPLGPEQPTLRLAHMVAAASPAVVISTVKLRRHLPPGTRVLLLDEPVIREAVVQLSSVDPGDSDRNSALRGGHPAYVIFTSGSTGTPKGVVVSHEALLSKISGYHRAEEMQSSTRYSVMSSLSFDPLLVEILCPLLLGAVCVMVPDSIREDAEAFAGYVHKHGISAIDATPRQIEALLPDGRFTVDLQTLRIGGDIFPAALANLLQSKKAAKQILNVYGPTEVTIDATIYQVPPSGVSGSVPIGKPLVNYSVYVLGRFLEFLPPGVVGELYISSRGLARGYLNSPGLTAQRFIANPFGLPGSRLYRTGDLAQWNTEGTLEFIGRADQQIKLRGVRIEPEEIEAVIISHPQVRQVAVILRDEQLVGYIVPVSDSNPDLAAVDQYIRERLPDYMVPSVLLCVSSIPLTPTGKLDWRALPLPARFKLLPVAPETPLQELLCNIFAELLGVEHVGIDDNFFALGGHSLLATRLVSRLRATLKMPMTVRALFEAPTVAKLAPRLERQKKNYSPVVAQVRPADMPLSFAQERFWFINQLGGASPEYNIPEAISLCGELDLEAVAWAIHAIVDRHEILRTRFDHVDGKPVQIIDASLTLPLNTEDISHLDETAQTETIAAALRREWEEPFDLAKGPLLRVKMLKLAERRHVLVRTFHHIIFDAWSHGIFNSEFSVLYNAYRNRTERETTRDILNPLPIQYTDFVLWQRQQLDASARALQLDYWQQQLNDLSGQLSLPRDRPRPPRQTFAANSCRFALSPAQTTGLRHLGRDNQTTLYMTLLSAFATLLSRYSGQNDVPVGSPVATRSDPHLEGLIGPFINSLVMRVQIKPNETFRELLHEVRRIALDAYQYQDLPFEQLVEALGPERGLNLTPFFQIMFAFDHSSVPLDLHGMEAENIRNDEVRAHFDMEIHAEEVEGRLEFFWVYNRDLFDIWRVEQMAHHFKNLLSSVLNAGTRVGELEILSASEKQEVLEGWNNTEHHYGVTLSVHQLFEQQAERTPQAVAVECGDQNLVYGELNRRADQWAHFLTDTGVRPDNVVGISMERSLEMVVAILAVLKAGAAYLPLPPDYPDERLKIMVDDSRPKALLLQKHLKERFAKYSVRALCLDEAPEEIAAASCEKTGIPNDPSNAAYLIYTSGSTGIPKGVMNTHDGLRNRLLWVQQNYPLHADDVVLQKAPFGFDVSVWEFLWPLMVGAKLVMARPGGHQDPQYLLNAVQHYRITTLHFVPSMLKLFLQAGGMENCRCLRRVICSGEALETDLAKECLKCIPAELHNMYGPAEASIEVTSWKCAPEELEAAGVAIGSPIANTQMYVLDSQYQPLPPGVTGELYIAGIGLARGYLNRSGVTAERFLPNPFSHTPGARMYRTGDLARWRSGGKLEYIGRIDSQVKIRGCRVELGEIEAHLREYSSISQAAAVYEEEAGDKKLTAYVVRKLASEALDANRLLNYLKSRLPLYSVPNAIVELSSLPLSANGKLDRKALPRLQSAASREAAYAPPKNAMEQAIAAVWKEKLKLKNISIFDNFFDSGGHSLKAIQVHSALRKLTTKPLMLTDIFKYPTIASLAEYLTRDSEERPAIREDEMEKLKQTQADREERLDKRLAARPGDLEQL